MTWRLPGPMAKILIGPRWCENVSRGKEKAGPHKRARPATPEKILETRNLPRIAGGIL